MQCFPSLDGGNRSTHFALMANDHNICNSLGWRFPRLQTDAGKARAAVRPETFPHAESRIGPASWRIACLRIRPGGGCKQHEGWVCAQPS